MHILLIIMSIMGLASAVAHAADAVPASGYFPVLPFDASDNEVPQLIPVASNHALDGAHARLTHAIIVIHDETRDANGAMGTLAVLAGGGNASTMIVAPQFLLPSDLARVATHLPEQGRLFATWNFADWPIGGQSIATPPQKPISSFTAIDLLLVYLSDHRVFPDLQTVTVAGFGAGANFVQHYAAFNAAAAFIDKQNINLRYVVAGATSYLYLTANRAVAGGKGFGRPDPVSCPDYNTYPYGLDALVPYARHVGANAAKMDYASRFILYLSAAGQDAFPENHCGALLQGKDSVARAQNFQAYIQSLYGDSRKNTQIFSAPKDATGDAIGLFGTACGMAVLFGDGKCTHAGADSASFEGKFR